MVISSTTLAVRSTLSIFTLFLKWYDRAMKANPLLTKTWTAFLLSGSSNFFAQALQRSFNPKQILSFSLQGAPPYSHFWFEALERRVGPGNAMLKTAMDQLLWRPPLILYCFVTTGLLSGQSWQEVKENIKRNYRTAVVNGWKMWPLIGYLTAKFVPAIYQSSALDLVGFIWDIYLSLLATGGTSNAIKEDDANITKYEKVVAAVEDNETNAGCKDSNAAVLVGGG